MMYPVYYALASVVAVLLSLHRTVHLPGYLPKKILLIGAPPHRASNSVTSSNVNSVAASGVPASRPLALIPSVKLETISDILSAPETLLTAEQPFEYVLPAGPSQDLPGLQGLRNEPINPALIASLIFTGTVLAFVFSWTWSRAPPRTHKRYVDESDTDIQEFFTEVQQLREHLLDRLHVLHLLADEQARAHDILRRLRIGDDGYQPDLHDDDYEPSLLEEQAQAEYDLRLSLWLRPEPDRGSEDEDASAFGVQSDMSSFESVMVPPLSIVKAADAEEDALPGDIGVDDFPRADLGPPFL